MTTTRLGKRGQITLPRDVRERLHLSEGQQIAFVVKGDDVTLQPLKTSLRDLRGSIAVTVPQDFEQIREHVKAARAETDDG